MKTLLCSALVILLFCGCSVVHSQQPVGLTPKDISNEVDDWEGVWSSGEGYSEIFVENGSNGMVRLAGMGRENGEIQLQTYDIQLRDAGKWTFVNMIDEDTDNGLYLWGRIKMEDGVALVWFPDVEKITTLIEAGTLPGTTNGSGSVLGSLTTNHYDIICSDSENILFEWDEPMVLWKMSK